jgi:outer membrane protein
MPRLNERESDSMKTGGLAPKRKFQEPDMKILIPFGFVRRAFTAVVSVFVVAGSLEAQEPAATMTLEEAISLARRNNPTFRATANDESVSDWQAREAYSQFLPALSVSQRFAYTASGIPQAVGAFTAADLGLGRSPEQYTSSYGVNLGLTVGGATFFQAAQARANSKAVSARIGAAEYTLATDVTRQYLAVLRARDAIRINRSAFESADQALKLATARLEVGDVTRLDVAQAEVDHGRAEVGVIQAENQYQTDMLRLMQQIGITLDRDIELTSTFEVFEPTWALDELLARALENHPQVVASRAAEGAAKASARAAAMNYLPTVSVGAGWNGFVRRTGTDAYNLEQARNGAENRIENCEFENALIAGLTSPLPGYPRNCSALALTPEQEQRALNQNSAFPFDYAANPLSVGITISMPIWDQFTREVRLQSARVAAQDASHQRRAEELSRRTEVATNLLALSTAYRTVSIEERNAARAGEQLQLARESYRLGAGSILELTTAQEQKVRADQAHLGALYAFHETLAALEAAVGQKLR